MLVVGLILIKVYVCHSVNFSWVSKYFGVSVHTNRVGVNSLCELVLPAVLFTLLSNWSVFLGSECLKYALLRNSMHPLYIFRFFRMERSISAL